MPGPKRKTNAAQKTLFDHFSKKQKGEENPPSMPNAALPLNHLDASIVPLAHVPPHPGQTRQRPIDLTSSPIKQDLDGADPRTTPSGNASHELLARASTPPLGRPQPSLTTSIDLTRSPSVGIATPKATSRLLAPIDLTSPSPEVSKKALFPIFTSKANTATQVEHNLSEQSSMPWDAPLPTSVFQHVRGLQTSFEQSSKLQPRQNPKARRGAHVPEEHSLEFLLRMQEPSIPLPTSCPATRDPSEADQRTWCDKWHPTQAQSVLGNVEAALYLRNWLKALEIKLGDVADVFEPEHVGKATRSTKRAREIVRAVARKRGKKRQRIDSDGEDDWIVDDRFIQYHTTHQQRDEDDFLPLNVRQTSLAAESDAFQEFLANTIILVGPPGSGKTSAVYACAEELGFEVFEVYPGIGKRNGASIDHLIGEVGKNHLVQASRITETSSIKTGLASFLSMKDKQDSARVQATDPVPAASSVRQSLILLEEVDILYREDVNFWPSVVDLIKDCKRPVICTCNDMSLVPIQTLPIQATLHFQRLTSEVALPYLQTICTAEGCPIEANTLADMLSVSRDGHVDLRKCINELQFWAPFGGSVARQDELKTGTNLKSQEYARSVEALSFADCFRAEVIEAHDENQDSNCLDDDELGHPIVFDGRSPPTITSNQSACADEIEAISLRALPCNFDTPLRTQAFERLFDLLKDHEAVPSLHLAMRDQFVVDYLPVIRNLLEADDEHEKRSEKREGRATRNSQRYVRTITLTDEQRRAMGETLLVTD